MRTLHLFAGAGGGLLADLILGHEPIAAVEWDPYCCQILRERAAEGWFPGLQVFEGDIRLFDASAWKGRVDCVSAGFPCQPHSVAGKRRGALDDRNLWPEVVRVLGEIRPRWFFGENVPGLVSNGFIGTVLGDLALLGYDARWTCLGADQVGAPHRRDRWWCLANAESREIDERKPRDMAKEAGRGQRFNPSSRPGGADVDDPESGTRQRATPREAGHAPFIRQDVPDAGGEGWPESTRGQFGSVQKEDGTSTRSEFSGDDPEAERWDWRDTPRTMGLLVNGVAPDVCGHSWWEVEPEIGRVTQKEENRVAKLMALGNGQVSLQAALAFMTLMGIFKRTVA